MEDTAHFRAMLDARGVDVEWVERAMNAPERVEDRVDGTRHYLCRIVEREGRWLRVVVNERVNPARRVTVFFDRRLRGE